MKIELGKFYRDGRGRKVGPMRPRTSIDRFSWSGVIEGFGSQRYAPDGDCSGDPRFIADNLVAEWADEPAGEKPADFRFIRDDGMWQEVRFAEEPTVTKASLLDNAKAAVADRGLNYGKPEDNFARIARLWSAHLYNTGKIEDEVQELTAIDVALMMDLMKTARLENDPLHQDSWVDKAGYAACGGEIAGGIAKDA
ncbi:MAG: hypothetical protein Unbinned2301contig1004_63 [Prokaryotic dsDNA virus sp.]|nr:MAG: hypothetical protein Unbinned2301contig1004_63 [Prokaryotic dsDNA virus sp.]|tara:strand:- start:11178 stop:11765 length:588 start_codon:yes stop_codon:yes gene_type:complete